MWSLARDIIVSRYTIYVYVDLIVRLDLRHSTYIYDRANNVIDGRTPLYNRLYVEQRRSRLYDEIDIHVDWDRTMRLTYTRRSYTLPRWCHVEIIFIFR